MSFVMPTIAEMNKDNAVERVMLTMLRALHTSDLAFTYQLYRNETVSDLAKVAALMLGITETIGCNTLTEEEIKEYMDLCLSLAKYSGSSAASVV